MTIQDQIITSANSYGVDPALALAVAKQESGFRQSAIGTSGEVGVFQLMPTTAANLGVNPYDLGSNIDGGVKLLKQNLDAYGGDPVSALVAYNAGPKAVDSGLVPSSTQDYVNKIVGNVYGSSIFGGSLNADPLGGFDSNISGNGNSMWVLGLAAIAGLVLVMRG
jgi:soluble lytic murein transglycosylase-like protein